MLWWIRWCIGSNIKKTNNINSKKTNNNIKKTNNNIKNNKNYYYQIIIITKLP